MKAQIYGTGSAGMHHIRALQLEGVNTLVLTDTSAEMRSTFLSRYRDRYGVEPPEHVFSEGPQYADIYVITTPPASHLDIARLVTGKAKDIIIEKPICAPAQYERLAAMNWGDCHVWVNYQYLIHPMMDWLRANLPQIASPVVGHIRWMEHSDFCAQAHPWAPKDWYLFNAERGGGAANEHSHGLALFIVGLAAVSDGRLSCTGSKIIKDHHDVYSYFSLNVRTQDGETPVCGTVILDFMCRTPCKDMLVICDEFTAGVDFHLKDGMAWVTPANGKTNQIANSVSREDEFRLIYRHIRECEDYAKSPVAIQNAIYVQQILSKHYEEICAISRLH